MLTGRYTKRYKVCLLLVIFAVYAVVVTGTGGVLAAGAVKADKNQETAVKEQEKLGDAHNGSRSAPVHLINLYDEDGEKITPDDDMPMPFSTRQTCGKCHSYDKIHKGWHFNYNDPAVAPGRRGEPWVLVDFYTRTQIPISSRGWAGTYKPQDIGMTAWQFMNHFGRQLPGGGLGEPTEKQQDEDVNARWDISGKLEIDCLACHNADARQNQSDYALQVARQNFRWAATAASGLAEVEGTASALPETADPLLDGDIKVKYDKNRFDSKERVYFNIVRKPPNRRCYFCHSTADVTRGHKPQWQQDEDIHIVAGLSCADCHRNGVEHRTTRDYEQQQQCTVYNAVGQADANGGGKSAGSNHVNKTVGASRKVVADANGEAGEVNKKAVCTRANVADNNTIDLSCRGCHLGNEKEGVMQGRMGAPRPEHTGIPAIHFEKLTCTACHSGPWPGSHVRVVKTSRIHGIGLHGPHALHEPMPHVYEPVFMRGADGKIGPYKLMWPAFWGYYRGGGKVKPLLPDKVEAVAGKILKAGTEDQTKDWAPLSLKQIVQTLKLLGVDSDGKNTSVTGMDAASDSMKIGQAVYVCGGKVYYISGDGKDGALSSREGDIAAKPYAWPLAHNVRPAGQSLGVHISDCSDCHKLGRAFFSGNVPVDSPLAGDAGRVKKMYEFEGLDGTYEKIFASTFVFRPFLKTTGFVTSAILLVVLLLYGLKALRCIIVKSGMISDKKNKG